MNRNDTSDFRVRQVLAYARRNLSPYLYLCALDEERSTASLGLQVQESIIDHGERGSALRFINLDNIVSIQWERKGTRTVFDAPSWRDFVKTARERYAVIVSRSQNVLLPSIYKKLVQIPEVNLSMSPLRRILIFIQEQSRISPRELGRRHASRAELVKGQRYFSLLEDLQFISREDGHYVSGEKMRNLQANEVRPPELYEMILAEVIQRRSKYLQEVLHWTMMVPFLRWSNTYYLGAYQAGHIITTERDEYMRNYERFYAMEHDFATSLGQIQKIIDVDVISREGARHYKGKQGILRSYGSVADRERILEPISIGIAR